MTDVTDLDPVADGVDDTDPGPPAEPADVRLLRHLEPLLEMPVGDRGATRHGDSRAGDVYILTPEIETAVKVAVLTGRPLLLGGPPGCGKSSLASFLARKLGVGYHEFVATEDSRPSDLIWRLDAVRRLGDANATTLTGRTSRESTAPYVEPGPLWWALDPESARKRGFPGLAESDHAAPPDLLPGHEPARDGAVLLIDEIDKADAAFCNGLLVPLGSRQAFVGPLDFTVRVPTGAPAWSPLTIITTNNERDLPEAFLRRCLVLRLPAPDADRLVEIVHEHFGRSSEPIEQLVRDLAEEVTQPQSGRPVSTAEFLDLVKVLRHLGQTGDLDGGMLEMLKRITLDKHALYSADERSWLR
ncbi:AAA domain (dynein-related subfamily) [Lentzea fradiae]|uniref:AAA domain (Dynein-related subfamily) n=1 Tax=Lentzea fradiae TaxID=200378 RepID=A0A1G8C0C5_9PSEU|nr:MoxR family ATPase [Lentzea fradiae]SDH38906.1 AAA domain (dynein-related subfamily) [Lentzea fradiae]